MATVKETDEPQEMYSTIAGVVRWSQGTIVLTRGQSIEEGHPLVEERPELFTYEKPPTSVRSWGKSPLRRGRVESGVQRPGEVRAEKGPIQSA
jgi:hypothetical protein